MAKANILVVGAGPVGLTAALELSRRGHCVRIIDREADFTPVAQSRALGVNNRTLQLLKLSGVSDRLIESGNKMSEIRLHNEKEACVLKFDFQNAGTFFPFMLVVPQGTTERLLAEALRTYGVDIEHNKKLIETNADPLNPSVTLEGADGAETISPDFLIGADGAGSKVRREFGFTFDGEGYPGEFGLVDIEPAEPIDASVGVVRFLEKGIIGALPLNDRLVRYISSRPDVSNVLPKDLNIKSVVWQSTFHVSFRHVKQMQKGAVFLAGDAAHIHSPVGGRGMNLGIEDACWLAWAIDEGRHSEYSRLRMPNVKKVIAQTRKQTDGLIKMNFATRFLRDHLAGKLLKIPMFKRAAIARVIGLDTDDPPWIGD